MAWCVHLSATSLRGGKSYPSVLPTQRRRSNPSFFARSKRRKMDCFGVSESGDFPDRTFRLAMTSWIGFFYHDITNSYNIKAFAGVTWLVFAAVFCCTPTAAFSAVKTAAPKEIIARVAAVKADGTLTLSSIGDAVLADVHFPNMESAAIWLSEYALQRDTSLTPGREDRYGRTQVRGQLQIDMLNDGAAVIYAAEEKIPDAWFAAEARARTAKRGVWDDRAASVQITANDTPHHIGTFRVIEGRITRIYEAKSATYINFGENWREDFSITIPAKLRRSMKSFLAAAKAGDRIRVRGYLHDENGPMIQLLRPDNLERI
jgi:hypothetical protein